MDCASAICSALTVLRPKCLDQCLLLHMRERGEGLGDGAGGGPIGPADAQADDIERVEPLTQYDHGSVAVGGWFFQD